jgi:pimeloyl-ACP methyl ester carboxylesterase
VRYLIRRRAEDGFGPIGLHAVSYSAGPAIIAATYPDIRAQIRFLVVIGGYYGIEDSIRYLTTGHYREPDDAADAPWRRRVPDSAMVWRFIRYNAEHAERPPDRVALAAVARIRLERPEADVSEFLRDLAPDARAIFDLADNRDPARVPALIDALPQRLREGLRGLDLSALDLSTLRARLILVHGRDDPVIPARESVRLAAALRPGQADVRLIDAITHASVGGFGILDGYRMWRAILSVLAARDGA